MTMLFGKCDCLLFYKIIMAMVLGKSFVTAYSFTKSQWSLTNHMVLFTAAMAGYVFLVMEMAIGIQYVACGNGNWQCHLVCGMWYVAMENGMCILYDMTCHWCLSIVVFNIGIIWCLKYYSSGQYGGNGDGLLQPHLKFIHPSLPSSNTIFKAYLTYSMSSVIL